MVFEYGLREDGGLLNGFRKGNVSEQTRRYTPVLRRKVPERVPTSSVALAFHSSSVQRNGRSVKPIMLFPAFASVVYSHQELVCHDGRRTPIFISKMKPRQTSGPKTCVRDLLSCSKPARQLLTFFYTSIPNFQGYYL